MNKLKRLRTISNLTIRDLQKYTKIRNATISNIENGKQPFREIHLIKLCDFFDVKTDYMLGFTNMGIGIYMRDKENNYIHVYISESEKLEIEENHQIIEEIVDTMIPDNNLIISYGNSRKNNYSGRYKIYRSCNAAPSDIEKFESIDIKKQIDAELLSLDTNQLNKALNFIKEYIKK